MAHHAVGQSVRLHLNDERRANLAEYGIDSPPVAVVTTATSVSGMSSARPLLHLRVLVSREEAE